MMRSCKWKCETPTLRHNRANSAATKNATIPNIVLSVLLRYTDADCPFGIFKLFLYSIHKSLETEVTICIILDLLKRADYKSSIRYINFVLVSYLILLCTIMLRVRVMVFNATFNNSSVISWRSVLLVEETGVHTAWSEFERTWVVLNPTITQSRPRRSPIHAYVAISVKYCGRTLYAF
jgi:hypothetical protein